MRKIWLDGTREYHFRDMGDIILRGEIDDAIQEKYYLYRKMSRDFARKAIKKRNPAEYLNSIDIEACGKSRVLFGWPCRTNFINAI